MWNVVSGFQTFAMKNEYLINFEQKNTLKVYVILTLNFTWLHCSEDVFQKIRIGIRYYKN